jgi:RHS repeat-associated protein
MSKPPEIVLCEGANDEVSPTIVSYICDLETGLISANDKRVQASSELPSIKSISYDSAGKVVSDTANESSIPGDRYKFVSREWNSETALQYNRATRCDDRKGRWMSQDPREFAGDDANLYRYVHHPKTEGQ